MCSFVCRPWPVCLLLLCLLKVSLHVQELFLFLLVSPRWVFWRGSRVFWSPFRGWGLLSLMAANMASKSMNSYRIWDAGPSQATFQIAAGRLPICTPAVGSREASRTVSYWRTQKNKQGNLTRHSTGTYPMVLGVTGSIETYNEMVWCLIMVNLGCTKQESQTGSGCYRNED